MTSTRLVAFALLALSAVACSAAGDGSAASSSADTTGEDAFGRTNDDPGAFGVADADAGADADAAPATDAGTDADADAGACFAPTGVTTATSIGFSGGGQTATEHITGVSADTGSGVFATILPRDNFGAAVITRSLPSADVTVQWTGSPDSDAFLSPSIVFTATAGTVTCGPIANGDYPCTFEGLILAPPASTDTPTCASAVLPTFTIHTTTGG